MKRTVMPRKTFKWLVIAVSAVLGMVMLFTYLPKEDSNATKLVAIVIVCLSVVAVCIWATILFKKYEIVTQINKIERIDFTLSVSNEQILAVLQQVINNNWPNKSGDAVYVNDDDMFVYYGNDVIVRTSNKGTLCFIYTRWFKPGSAMQDEWEQILKQFENSEELKKLIPDGQTLKIAEIFER